MKVVKNKEYRVPICDFGKAFDITEKIEGVHYYGKTRTLKETGEDEEDYVSIEVVEDA